MAFPPSAGFTFTVKIRNDTYPTITAAKCNHHGRAVFITGASKGIGRATAIAYVQAGASSIAIGARSPVNDLEAAIIKAARVAGHAPPQVLKLRLDVSDEKSVASAAARVERAFGCLDILVNNAGQLEKWLPLADTDPAAWWNTWEVNVKGAYLVTRALLPLLLRGGERTIVNISSIGAHLLQPNASAYQASKLALLRLTEFTSIDYAADGVLAFTIHPGAVATELALDKLPKELHPNLVDTPELAADTIVWLTQKRREWLAGRYLSANWDMDEIMSRKNEIVKGDKLKVRLVL